MIGCEALPQCEFELGWLDLALRGARKGDWKIGLESRINFLQDVVRKRVVGKQMAEKAEPHHEAVGVSFVLTKGKKVLGEIGIGVAALQVARDGGVCDEAPQQLIDCKSRARELARKVLLEGAHFLDNFLRALGLESLHGEYAREGSGRRLDAGLVVDIKHGPEEGHEKLDWRAVSAGLATASRNWAAYLGSA